MAAWHDYQVCFIGAASKDISTANFQTGPTIIGGTLRPFYQLADRFYLLRQQAVASSLQSRRR
jgi:hypothetical protein